MPTENLLDEFPQVLTQAWEEAIRKDLKGADYAKKLIWKAEDGITVKPYYRSEDLVGLPHLSAGPGAFPYVRGTGEGGGWKICEEIYASSCAEANRLAREAVLGGAEEIAFRGVPVKTAVDLSSVVANLGTVGIHFRGTDEALFQLLLKNARPEIKTADLDPLVNLDLAATAIRREGFRPLAICATEFEAATTVQEIGFAVAMAIEFIAEMQARGVNVNRAASALTFSVSIGSNYFFQIAKLRALRILWAMAVSSFDGFNGNAKVIIHARTSFWNKTIYDPHVNVLRATTEAMSAALGGADVITVAPFDEPYKHADSASRRLARNTQIVLKAEAYLDRVADAGGGSYYLEALTDQVARRSWEVVQRIEAAGGFVKAKADGLIARELEDSRKQAEAAVASRQRVLVGTNQYANLNERALSRIKVHTDARRGAEVFEKIRLRTERACAAVKKCPRFLLAMVGDPKMSAARAGFAANFFACGGFEVVTQRFVDIYDISVANADVIVLCSSDPEYLSLTDRLMMALKALGEPTLVVIAGNPESREQLTELGVAGFVHVRSNIVETLEDWQRRLGVDGEGVTS